MGRSMRYPAFWTLGREELLARLGARDTGLDSRTAARQRAEYGPNSDQAPSRTGVVRAVARRLLEPLCLLLLAAGFVAVWSGDTVGGSIIVLILALSIGLDTWQERRATEAAELLRQSVATKAEVLRDRKYVPIDVA